MSEAGWQEICQPESAVPVDAHQFCIARPAIRASPIDDYYSYAEHVVKLGSAKALEDSSTLGRLLLLGMVSGVEAYFRAVLAGLIQICPMAREAASGQMLALGAVYYYGANEIEWSLVEGISLAGGDEIKTRTKKLSGIEIPNGSSVDAALMEFDKVCHLRHAAAHARGVLGRGNAVVLGLEDDQARRAVQFTFAALQRAGAACHSAVRAYNRYVFRKTVERWIGRERITRDWKRDADAFRPLYELFSSKVDAVGPSNAYLAYRSVVRASKRSV